MSTTPSSCSNIRYIRRSWTSGGTITGSSASPARTGPGAAAGGAAGRAAEPGDAPGPSSAASEGGAKSPSPPVRAGDVGSAARTPRSGTSGCAAPTRPATGQPPRSKPALASNSPSARRTACSTVRSTVHRSWIRTSALAGWTLTSTALPGSCSCSTSDGRAPAGRVERYAASAARRIPGSRTSRPLTTSSARRVAAPTSAGRSTSPDTRTGPRTSSTSRNPATASGPQSAASRARNEGAAGRSSATRPSCRTVRCTSRRSTATACTASTMARHSARAPRRNFCRAGVL